MGQFARLAFTPAVRALQTSRGSRAAYARVESKGQGADILGDSEAAFIAARDSFYLASVGETGWPYLQHRGGPAGFVRVLDPHTLGFADVTGNRQYITAGNVAHDDRVALFFMDYPNQTRLKLLAHAEISSDAAMLARLTTPGGGAPERAFLLHIEAVDWNCPQHITPRFTEAEVAAAVAPLRAQLAQLEAENRDLRVRLSALAGSATPES